MGGGSPTSPPHLVTLIGVGTPQNIEKQVEELSGWMGGLVKYDFNPLWLSSEHRLNSESKCEPIVAKIQNVKKFLKGLVGG